MTTHNFKVGDQVTLKEYAIGVSTNHVCRIEALDSTYCTLEDYAGEFRLDNLLPYPLPEPLPAPEAIQAGDTVMRITRNCKSIHKGDTAIVETVREDGTLVLKDYPSSYSPIYFRRITPAAPSPSPVRPRGFKVGDRVRRINGTFRRMKVGDEDTITKVYNNHNLRLKNYSYGHSPHAFELVTSVDTPFSVGDRVQLKERQHGLRASHTYRITALVGTTDVTLENLSGGKFSGVFPISNLVREPVPVPTPAATIQVGDVVRRIIGSWQNMNAGDTGTVTEITGQSVRIAEFRGVGGNGAHALRRLEFVSRPEPVTQMPTAPATIGAGALVRRRIGTGNNTCSRPWDEPFIIQSTAEASPPDGCTYMVCPEGNLHDPECLEIVTPAPTPEGDSMPTSQPLRIGDTVRRRHGTGKNGRSGSQSTPFMIISTITSDSTGEVYFGCEEGFNHKASELVQQISVAAPTEAVIAAPAPAAPVPPAPTITSPARGIVYRVPVGTYHPYKDKLAYMRDPLIHDLILTPTKMKTFLEKTGLKIAYLKETSVPRVLKPIMVITSYPKIVRELETAIELPKHTVKLISYNGSSGYKARFIQLISEILTPVVKRNIKFKVPHGRASYIPTDKSNFVVSVWTSTSGQSRSLYPPSTLYGKTIGCASEGFEASGQGLPIMVEGYCVAELFPDGVFIHFDAVHAGTGSECYIFARMLQDIAAAYAEIDWSKLTEERALKAFAEKSIRRNSTRNKDAISTLEKDIRQTKDVLFTKERELSVIKAGTKDSVDLQAQIMEEFKRLREGYANIETANFRNEWLTVVTAPLNATCKRTEKQYHLGRIKIQIPFKDRRAYLKMSCVDSSRTVPHTNTGNGQVCLGSALDEVYSYIAGYEMLAVVGFMVAFLENGIDTNDLWGKKLKSFPRL